MKPETFLELLRITLRFIEIFYGRRPPRERAAPRAEPASEAAASPVAAEAEPRRQSGSGALVGSMVVGAVAAGAVAYLVVRPGRRAIAEGEVEAAAAEASGTAPRGGRS